ncbi:hypothetical protein KAR91_78720 [Candidatus Pacearchaeota archaeon]|nr:hypothetical protein [Candidatus Pacearchaeota archaeon]
MKNLKKNRLRQLVSWGYITQPQANQLWREYLRGVIPTVKRLPKVGNWIDRYIHQIVYGPLPTIDVKTGKTIMWRKK